MLTISSSSLGSRSAPYLSLYMYILFFTCPRSLNHTRNYQGYQLMCWWSDSSGCSSCSTRWRRFGGTSSHQLVSIFKTWLSSGSRRLPIGSRPNPLSFVHLLLSRCLCSVRHFLLSFVVWTTRIAAYLRWLTSREFPFEGNLRILF